MGDLQDSVKDGWIRRIKGPNYEILVMEGIDDPDPVNANVDIEVNFADGSVYSGTLFTVDNLKWLLERGRGVGEDPTSPYFWSPSMAVVRRLAPDAIAEVIAALVRDGNLEKAFIRMADLGGEEAKEA